MRAPIRRSLLRRITWFGGDRRLVGGAGLLLFMLGFIMFAGYGFSWGLPIIVPVGLFIVVLWIAQQANSADSFMVDVVLRQFKYRKYYAPKSDIGVEHPLVRDYAS